MLQETLIVHTVDGRNPAPPLQSHYLECFIVANSYQLVQGFFHPLYGMTRSLPEKLAEEDLAALVQTERLLMLLREGRNW